jgi:hypothetical protein
MPMKPVSSCFLDMFNYFHGYSNRQEDLHTYTVPSRPMNPLTPLNNVIIRAMLKQVVIQLIKDGIFRFISYAFASGPKPEEGVSGCILTGKSDRNLTIKGSMVRWVRYHR